MDNECCAKCRYYHRLKNNFKVGEGFEESHCCDLLLHLPENEPEGWVQEVTPQDMCGMYEEKDHIADTDKMIERTPNDCETCIHNKGVLECDMYGCKYESNTKNDKVDCEHTDCKNCVNHKYCDYEPNCSEIPTGSITKTCRSCRNFGTHHGICEICKDNKCWTENEPTKNDLGVDCISRKAALDITWHDPSYSDPLNVLTEVRDKIRELPSVTPQLRKGHWISTETKGVRYAFWCRYKCSLCGELSDYKNFCPNCGAKMESEDKE